MERRADQRDVVGLHDAAQLGAHVVGARQVAVRQEVVVAPLLDVLAGLLGRLVGVVGVQQRQVVAVLVRKQLLHLVGALARVVGPHPDLRHRQQRRDGQDLVGAVELGRRDEHDGEGRVERELGREAAQRRQLAVVVQAGEVVELLERAHHGLGRRRVHQVEVHQVLDAELLQLEDRARQVRPQDLGVRLLDELPVEGLLRVQAEALARPRAAGAAGALLRRRLGDGRHEQRLDPRAGVVDLLLAEAGVHHVDDAVDGQTGLGDVGGHDALAAGAAALAERPGRLVEDALLLVRRQGAVERVHGHGAGVRLADHVVDLEADAAAGVLDLLLARQEEQDVALGLAGVDLQHGPDGGLDVVALGLGREEDLDGVGPAGHGEQRRVEEVGLELLGVEGGRHDDDLEVPAPLRDLLEQGHEDVGGEGALVGLVEDDAAVARHVGVVHRLAQQLAVRHVLEQRLLARPVLEADAVADLLAQLDVELVGDALGDRHGRHAARLRAGDELARLVRQLVVEHVLRDLGRLAGARLADEDEDLAAVVQVEELLPLPVHGQLAAGLEDAEVLLRVRVAGPRVDVAILDGGGLQRRRLAALELVERRLEAVAGALVEVGQVRVRLLGDHGRAAAAVAVAVAVRLESLRILRAVRLGVRSLEALCLVGHGDRGAAVDDAAVRGVLRSVGGGDSTVAAARDALAGLAGLGLGLILILVLALALARLPCRPRGCNVFFALLRAIKTSRMREAPDWTELQQTGGVGPAIST